MDKTVLIEYADMKEEIKDLRRRITEGRKELDKLNSMVVTDSVTCGKKGKKPLRTVKIQGRPILAITMKSELLKKRISRMEKLKIELLEKQNEVEEFIEQIEKSKLRTLFRFYYIDNLTWEMVSMKMNYLYPKKSIPFTNESCRKLHDRFFEKVS